MDAWEEAGRGLTELSATDRKRDVEEERTSRVSRPPRDHLDCWDGLDGEVDEMSIGIW
jgi:hypothetical protein